MIVFATLYMQYYHEVYRDKILDQARKSLEMASDELERQEKELYAIAFQNSSLMCTLGSYLKTDYCATEVRDLLQNEVATHSCIEGITYYNTQVPDYLYSQNGTISPKFYMCMIGEEQQNCSFPDYLQEFSCDGWSDAGTVYTAVWKRPTLQYIIHTQRSKKETGYWIFHIDETYLKELLYMEDSVTALYSKDGNLIFSTDFINKEVDENNVLKMKIYVGDNGLYLERIIETQSLFQEVHKNRMIFSCCMLLLLTAGSVLVAFLSFYNNRPLKELQLFCQQKFEDIPETVQGMDVVRFTIDKMDERVKVLEQKRKCETLLLRLIYGKIDTSENEISELENSGLYQSAELYRAILITYTGNVSGSDIGMYFKMMLDEKCELHFVEYAKKNVLVGILGIQRDEDTRFCSDLESVVEKISEHIGESLYAYVGGWCEKIEEVHWSYMQTLLFTKKEKKQGKYGVMYQIGTQQSKENYFYPRLEMDALYEALVSADYHKAELMTDVLLDIIQEKSDNSFACISLCYDVINTYFKASTELGLEDIELTRLMNSKEVYQMHDVEDLVMLIAQQKQKARYLLKKNKKEKKEEVKERKEEVKEKKEEHLVMMRCRNEGFENKL